MQLNISHEVTTTETKTVDVELPFFTRGGHAMQYVYCVNNYQEVIRVYDTPSYSCVHHCSASQVNMYNDFLKEAMEGNRITRDEFAQAYISLTSNLEY